MKATNALNELTGKATAFRLRIDVLREKCKGTEEAAKQEAIPRIERVETMVSALERDLEEVKKAEGADHSTVTELALVIEKELESLEPEIEALLLGNPTTVSAALDASAHATEKLGEAIKTVTSKISLRK